MNKAKLLSTYVLIVMLLSTVIVTAFFYTNLKQTNTAEVSSTLASQKIKIENMFDNLFFSMSLVETIIQLDYDRFTQEDLAHLLTPIVNQNEVRNISILPDGIVEYVYPLEGNEQAIGDNIFEMSNRRKEAEIALETRQTILCGPYTLTQGGSGLITRKAVFLENEDGTEEFWGFIAIVMDTNVILDYLDLHALETVNLEYSLTATVNAEDTVLIESSEHFEPENAMFVELPLPNGKWTLGISKSFSLSQSLSVFAILFFGVVLSILVYISILKKETDAYNSNNEKYIDTLTKLYNRKKLVHFSEDLLKQKPPKSYTLFFIDINNFKPINDTYGHDIGDIYLINLARRLQSVARGSDLVIRLGGDEFAIILHDVYEQENVAEFISRLDSLQEMPIEIDGHLLPLSISYGYVVNEAPKKMPFDEVLQLADQKMYEDKKQKKQNSSPPLQDP